MTTTQSLYIEDIDAQIAAGYDSIKLYSDTAPDGDFTTLVATEALVADQLRYSITDPTGDASTWYRYKLYDAAGPTYTTFSPPWQVDVVTALDILIEATTRCGGFAGTMTATGGANSFFDDVLRDNSEDEDYLGGLWFLRPAASDPADVVHRARPEPFVAATGEVLTVRDWVNVPADGDVYVAFRFMPPVRSRTGYSWMDALAEGLAMIEYPDELNIGTGTAVGQNRFDLTPFGYVEPGRVYRVIGREIDTDGVYHEMNWGEELRTWEAVENGRGSVTLILEPPPSTTQDVIVSCHRRFDRVYELTDETDCPPALAAAACVVKVYEYLNSRDGGNRWAAELAGAWTTFYQESPFTRTGDTILGV